MHENLDYRGGIKEESAGERWLVFADTPLQVSNSLHILYGIASNAKVDLMIYPQFEGAVELAKRTECQGVFDEVIVLDFEEPKSFLHTNLQMVGEYFGHRKRDFGFLEKRSYERLFIACPTVVSYEVAIALKDINPALEVLFYEDGTGSYSGNVFRGSSYPDDAPRGVVNVHWYWRLLKRLSRAFGLDGRYRATAIYVKVPDLVDYDPPFQILQLPTKETPPELQKALFGDADSSMFDGLRVVFLDTPRDAAIDVEAAAAIDACLKESLDMGVPCAIRNHPRSTTSSELAGTCRVVDGGMWEFVSAYLDDGCILAGLGSSAQLAPKIENGNEQPLLFLHRLAYKEQSLSYKKAEKVLKIARSAYDNNNLILAPKSYDELLSVLGLLCEYQVEET